MLFQPEITHNFSEVPYSPWTGTFYHRDSISSDKTWEDWGWEEQLYHTTLKGGDKEEIG